MIRRQMPSARGSLARFRVERQRVLASRNPTRRLRDVLTMAAREARDPEAERQGVERGMKVRRARASIAGEPWLACGAAR
jgi:hypothetical protein